MHRAAIFVVALLSLASACAQTVFPDVSTLTTDAAAAYDAKDWNAAVRLYRQIVERSPQPRAWFRLGVALRNAGNPDEAIAAFERGIRSGMAPYQGEYGIATVHATQKNPEAAFTWLQRAVEHGYNTPEALKSEPSLAVLTSDPRFAAIVERATMNQRPCAHRAENRQFDFWVGDWDVVTA